MMMRALTIRLATLGVAAVALTSCNDSLAPFEGLRYSSAHNSCGPAGGAATMIVLANRPITAGAEPYPSIDIYITASVDNLAGKSYQLGGPTASATANKAAGEIVSDLTGTVTVNAASNTSGRVTGELEATIPGYGSIHADFDAAMHNFPIMYCL